MVQKNDFQNLIGDDNPIEYSYENEYGDVSEGEFYKYFDKDSENIFFLVGFPKAATSTISSMLYRHKDVCLPIKKEPFFFSSDEYDFGMGFYWQKYFNNYRGEKMIGEANTMNSIMPFVPKRIYDKLPNAKIIISLRNPIDRAYSNWWMYKANGEEDLDFEEAVEWELKELKWGLMPYNKEDDDYWKWYSRRLITRDHFIRRKTPRTYLTRGYYAEHIRKFLKYFSKNQILFVFQEDLEKDKEKTFNQILSFLNLDEQRLKEDSRSSKNYHPSRNSLLLTKFAGKMKYYQHLVPKSVLDTGNRMTRKMDKKIFNKTKMKDSTREKLVDFFKEKNKELEKLIGVDLSAWNK